MKEHTLSKPPEYEVWVWRPKTKSHQKLSITITAANPKKAANKVLRMIMKRYNTPILEAAELHDQCPVIKVKNSRGKVRNYQFKAKKYRDKLGIPTVRPSMRY